MRFLFVTGREISYQRNEVLWRAFNRLGEVESVISRNQPNSILLNSIALSFRLIPKLLRRNYDLVFVGFYGQLLMLPSGLFARQPILLDAFVSTFDTLSADRNLYSPDSPISRIFINLDRYACHRAAHVLLDTQRQAEYFSHFYELPPDKLSVIPVGCNEELFYPRKNQNGHLKTRILYYCSYLPLHGAGTVVEAASLLEDKPIEIRLIGRGQTYQETKSLASRLSVKNIEFFEPVPLDQLPSEIAQADICLGGHFGLSEKAARVVPGKVYQILAMQKPLIASNKGANLDFLQHEVSGYLCNPGDPEDLANAIHQLHTDHHLRKQLADNGRALYESQASEKVITQTLKSIIDGLVG